MPASLVFALNAQLPVLAISYLFSPRDVGHYAMVQGLLVTTTMMAGESVRRVYLHRASQSGLTSAQLRRDYRRTLRLMAAVALPPVVLLMVFGEPLFAVALGREWADAGKYAAVLSPWFYFQWLSMPASALVVSLKRQRFWLYFQHAVLFGQLLGIIIGYLSGGGVIFVLAGYMVARSVSLLFLIVSVDSMIAKRSANL
jgi:O-antigen/teichoic acid export membrane protein